MEDGPGKERQKVVLWREKQALQHPQQNRTDNIVQELSEKWPQKKKRKNNKNKNSNAKEPYESGKKKTNRVTKDRQPGERRP